jgi:hypothetical protein
MTTAAGSAAGADPEPGSPVGSGPAGVLISYAHDDAVHEERVRDFWLFLRASGVNALLDLPAAEQRQDWAEWMTRQVRDAALILVVASPAYRRRAEGDAGPDEGRGVQWEARMIRDRCYAGQQAGLQLVLPVVLPGCSPRDLPLWLAPASATHSCRSATKSSGMSRSRPGPGRRPHRLPGQPRDPGTAGRRRPGQQRVAARPVGHTAEDRRPWRWRRMNVSISAV